MTGDVKLLVIAERTADSDVLHEAIDRRAARGNVHVTLVVPATWEADDPHASHEAARMRLDRAIARLEDRGIPAFAVLSDPDPVAGLADLWNAERFDAVLVCTPPDPQGLRYDLVHRVARYTGGRVEHLVAEPHVPA